jgi:hypothetical protein
MLRICARRPADRAVTGCNRKGGITQGSAIDFGMIPNRTMLLSVGRACPGRLRYYRGATAMPAHAASRHRGLSKRLEAFRISDPNGRALACLFSRMSRAGGWQRSGLAEIKRDASRPTSQRYRRSDPVGLRHCSRVDVAMAEGSACGPFHKVRPRRQHRFRAASPQAISECFRQLQFWVF